LLVFLKTAAYLDPVSNKYLEKEKIEQVEKEFEKLYPLSTNRRNILSRNSKQSESTVPMACENVEVDADVDDNVFDIDKFVHSLGFKASNQVKDDSNIKQEYTYFKTLLAHEKKVKLIFKIWNWPS